MWNGEIYIDFQHLEHILMKVHSDRSESGLQFAAHHQIEVERTHEVRVPESHTSAIRDQGRGRESVTLATLATLVTLEVPGSSDS